MPSLRPSTACWLALLAAGCGVEVQGAEQRGTVDWPSFRGPFAQGVSEGFATATEWDLASGHNVLWRVPLAGLAHSSPVVFGDSIFLTTAISADEAVFAAEKEQVDGRSYGWIRDLPQEGSHRFELACLDKHSGATLWSRTAFEGVPFSRRHPQGTHANPTPAVDAEHVVAYFGAEGLYCYDHDGNLSWQKDLGDLAAGYYVNPSIQWGIASSPVLHGGRVIVLCDVLGESASFLAAYDADTGAELWKVPRADVPTWGTPTVDVAGGRSQVIVNGYDLIGGYDLESGRSLWTMEGGGSVPIPTPVVAHDLIFVTNAGGMPGGKGAQSQRAPIFAVHAGAVGEVVPEGRYMQWATPRGGNYISSPLVYGDELYCVTGSVLTCYDAKSGLEHYRQRTGGVAEFSSSPVAADGKVYMASDVGEVHVLRAGPVYELLATNAFDEPCFASPAISEGVLYWRTTGHLVAVGAGERVAAVTPRSR